MGKIENFIWYEKFRPRKLEQMILSSSNKKVFENYLEDKDIPHLLFHGPPGSGKTTLSQIFISSIPSSILSLNAGSEEGGVGIDVVRGKIKQFAASQSVGGILKIVFIDEADSMSLDAQKGLKNPMETYSSNCRFILTSNSPDRIEDAIRSRCTIFEFRQYSKLKLEKYLESILEREQIKYREIDLSTLINRLYPDIRSIINNLQLGSSGGKKFDIENCFFRGFDFSEISKKILSGQLKSLRELWAGTVDFLWLYKFLFDSFVSENMKGDQIIDGIQVIAEYMYKDNTVADREINMTACCMELMVILGVKKINF